MDATTTRPFYEGEPTLYDVIELLKGIDARFSDRLDGIDTRLDGIDSRLDDIDMHLDHIEGRLDPVESRLSGVERSIYTLTMRVEDMQDDITAIKSDVIDLLILHDRDSKMITGHEIRLGNLETAPKS